MIKIVCVGKIKEKYLQDAIGDYVKRISKYHKVLIAEIDNSNMIEEGEKILNSINDKDYVVALDVQGKELSSLEFASFIDKQFIVNSNITFVIGGSLGLSEAVYKRANFRLSFSKLTFPHQLFRVFLLEQIYRSFKILNNETYHK